ncbi:MAG: hypothetical protein U9O97_03965 [Elusimicrobiota bacterium]|nr:hypothetical protein [Elusimicrobiota bacterium]
MSNLVPVQLSEKELDFVVSHFAIPSKKSFGGYLPFAFTEQGVAMLSSVLNSERAVMVNISIMRVFSKLKELALSHSELLRKVEALERKYGEHDRHIGVIFATLKKMLTLPKPKLKVRRCKSASAVA